jgi:light-regulated signal transduction histidine kinase (bacteriophytochrome)
MPENPFGARKRQGDLHQCVSTNSRGMHEAQAETKKRLESLAAELAEARQALEEEAARRRSAEDQWRKAAGQVERLREDLGRFTYHVSHDLQEPLRAVGGFARLLERRYRGQLDAQADEYLALVVDGARRLGRMIEDLLVYSRIGTHGGPFEPTDCGQVVDKAIDHLKTAIADKGATVTRDELPTVVGDGRQLVMLFERLFDNAIKFRGHEGPQVHVSSRRSGSAWTFSIRDNGLGIERKHAGEVFLPFRRLGDPEKYPGTGMGLAVSKQIVERHGGRIWVESEPGKGATFYFTIPT